MKFPILNFKFLIIILTFSFLVFSLLTAFAFDLEIPKYKENQAGQSLVDFLQWAFVFAIAAAGILALLMIMIAGFQYITAAGSEARAGAAKSRIQNAIIGLILALCSYLILNTINPDLVKIKLPTLTPIEKSTFNWDDYLPEQPKAGDEAHNVPDGQICATSLDCYYSRECNLGPWLCPSDTAKTPYVKPEDCNPKCKTDETPTQCEQQKVCEAVKSSDKNSVGGALAIKNGELKVLYMQKCAPITEHPKGVEQCYDEDAVCHYLHNLSCYARANYGDPCAQDTDCKDYQKDRICNPTTKLCDTKTGDAPPEQDEIKNQFKIENTAEKDGYKYYLISTPYEPKLIKKEGNTTCADENFNAVWLPDKHNNVILCQNSTFPETSSQPTKTFRLSDNQNNLDSIKQTGLLFIEVGWLYQTQYKQDIKCKDIHGPYFQEFAQAGREWCENIENPLGMNDTTNKCCYQYYPCCIPSSTTELCKSKVPELDPSVPKDAMIESAGENDIKDAMGLDITNQEVWNLPRILCRVKLIK